MSRRFMVIGVIGVMCGAILGLAWSLAQGAELHHIEKVVRTRFPKVRQISTAELAAWLDSERPKPVLLDVRQADEYAVSHLAGALRVEPDPHPTGSPLPGSKEAPIVTYCSVGYRSSALADRLQKEGYTNVRNLEGSIFRWANEGRPLWKGDKRAATVHPYGAMWAHLVDPAKRESLGKTKRRAPVSPDERR